MGAPTPISRNLTTTFNRYRLNKRGGIARGGLLGAATTDGQRLLGCDADSRGVDAIEMSSMPPKWVDAAHDAREDVKGIREKLKELTKVQNRRLLKVFGDDAGPDKEIQAITSDISAKIRRCEQSIHQIKKRGSAIDSSKSEIETQLNVQRGLATTLQDLSQEFRAMQKDYLGKIRERQRGSLWDDATPAPGGFSANVDVGFNEGQLLELEQMESTANSRSTEINQIASSISDLHTVFKELAVLVIDQGSILDRIDYNIEQVVDQSREANVQLTKAEKSQKSNRALKCILCLVALNVVMIVILVVKSR
eukprot:TRINITY_DN56323_c0_g1_i1.p1 TRINITY_DN56323_c0_g1~~TRINITY_DN56323_c0_g1_i1.p1  ORF type:complete len:308 (+),score=51.30 TRINITY_DN56323_c0_g1_i1:158-1081(+)